LYGLNKKENQLPETTLISGVVCCFGFKGVAFFVEGLGFMVVLL